MLIGKKISVLERRKISCRIYNFFLILWRFGKNSMRKKLYGWFLFSLSFIFSLYAQKDTLRIGLVLSGGGAKGYAHIGVLKILEENNLTPQYLTGTSIGAIVGAYYIAGYSADEIKKKFREMDMKNMMQDKLPRRYLPLYEKKTGRDNFFYFPIDKKNLSIHLPRGLTNYQLFYNRLPYQFV